MALMYGKEKDADHELGEYTQYILKLNSDFPANSL